MKKTVFLDKDGTLVRNVPYNVDPTMITFEEHVVEGLQQLQLAGFTLVMISNQPGIALKYFTEKDLQKAFFHIRDLLAEDDVRLDGFYYCPHIAGAGCTCRKPAPGLLLQAATDMEIDLSRSWMIGDILDDVEAGRLAGCETILVNNGNETEWVLNKSRTPHFIVQDMKVAADIICSPTKARNSVAVL